MFSFGYYIPLSLNEAYILRAVGSSPRGPHRPVNPTIGHKWSIFTAT